MAKLDWRGLVAGVAGGSAPGVYQKKLMDDAKMRLEADKFLAKKADYASQAQRRNVQSAGDMQKLGVEQMDELEDNVLDSIMAGNLTRDEKTGATKFDSAKAYTDLESIKRTDLFSQVMERNAKRIKAQTDVVKAEGNRMAANWNLFKENSDSNPEMAGEALAKIVPGATNFKRNQAGNGFIIDKEDGTSIEIGDDDIENQNRTAQQEAEGVAMAEAKAAALASPGTKMALYTAAKKEAAEEGYAWPYTGYTDWAKDVARASVPDTSYDAQKEMVKANKELFVVIQKKQEEASSKVFLAKRIQYLLNTEKMDVGAGTILKMKWNNTLAAINGLTGANIFEINPDLPFWQQAHQSFMKIAYSNRSEFMPGQLSNMENMKLLEMEASLSTHPLATKMILEGVIAHEKFKRKIMSEYRKWMLPKARGGTDGSMVKTINGKLVAWEDYQQEQIDMEARKSQAIVQKYIDEYEQPEDKLSAEEAAQLAEYERE